MFCFPAMDESLPPFWTVIVRYDREVCFEIIFSELTFRIGEVRKCRLPAYLIFRRNAKIGKISTITFPQCAKELLIRTRRSAKS